MQQPPFRDPAAPLRDRIDDLMSRLTLDEKVGLLHQYQAPVERLGLGAFRTGTEALHGLGLARPRHRLPAGHRAGLDLGPRPGPPGRRGDE
ncbi:hypothetical protein GCM10020220_002740 [Nonomuraea rubra]